tara:strand:+ start:369 stop:536 length:168 start_codon:yes stop_codon:yes gene_type:complete
MNKTLTPIEAVRMVLDAATEDGHELSDKEICDAIDWEMLRRVLEENTTKENKNGH